jgi:DNA-binding NtrC family response regulator
VQVLISLTDVEPAVRLNKQLESDGVETDVVSPLDDVRGAIKRGKPDVIVLTGGLVDPQNVALVREMLWEGVAVVGLADVRDAEIDERLKTIGFVEVYAKPIVIDEVADAIRRLIDRQRLSRLTGLIGQSEGIREVLVKVEQIAPVSSTVLIEGESGTGKELVARAIHRLGPRRNRPFIAVNVGALPDTLLESELFGHEKGAFTGAAERRIGRFELANTGTLFLDEIGDVPLATQVKLLRVLEEREITRVGGTQSIPVDVRVVAATNNPLKGGVEEGRFRSDLYYRLNVLSIYLPPLRERREDIPILVRQFITELSKLHDRPFKGITPDALELLVQYAWPGNVRELRNLVESMVVLAPGREIGPADIPRQIREGGSARFLPVHVGPLMRERAGGEGRELEFILRSLVELKLQVEELRRQLGDERAAREQLARAAGALGTPIDVTEGTFDVTRQAPALSSGGSTSWPVGVSAPRFGGGGIEPRDQPSPAVEITISPSMGMAAIERSAIEAALRETRGNRRKAAELLGIGERTLYRKLRDYQLLVDTSALD